jgi:hypothetical protein
MLVPVHHRFVDQCCLVWVHLIKLASNMDVGFQLCQPQNAITFCLTENDPSTEAKQDGTQLSNAMCIHLGDGVDHPEKETEQSSAQFNISFHFRNILFCFIAI